MKTKLEAPTVLKTIFDRKTEEVAARQQKRSLAELQRAASLKDPARGFRRALADKVATDAAAVIAEVKKRAPVKASFGRIFVQLRLLRAMSRAARLVCLY